VINSGENMNNGFVVGGSDKSIMYELKREYVRRILMFWQFGPN
jgi:hypothetical protein